MSGRGNFSNFNFNFSKMTTAGATTVIPRGKCVSGRVWKKTQGERFSKIKHRGVKVLTSSWEEKLAKKAKKQEMQALEQEIRDRKRKEIEERKAAREEKLKRKQENEFKSAQVQVITKTSKLKGLSKKQLRHIKKTRLTKQGVVEYVGLYDK